MSLHTTPRSLVSIRFLALMLLGFAFALAQAPAFAAATTPAAPLERLSCGDANSAFQRFDMVLDPNPYTPGSDYYWVRRASLLDGYATANLICYNKEPGEYDCVGYWFGVRDVVAEVQVKHQPDGSRVAISKTYFGDEFISVCGAQTPIPDETSSK